MRLFDRERIYSKGLSLWELLILGCAAALLWLLSSYLTAAVCGGKGPGAQSQWPTLREALGIAVGVPLFGIGASNWLRLGLIGQLLAVPFAVAGGGPALALVIDYVIRALMHRPW